MVSLSTLITNEIRKSFLMNEGIICLARPLYESEYSIIDQVKFMEESLSKT